MNSLIEAVDSQNRAVVEQIISSDQSPICPRTVKQCVLMAIGSEQYGVVRSLLSYLKRKGPKQTSFVLDLFKTYASEGLRPQIILILQDFIPPSELAACIRGKQKISRVQPSFYVIDAMEPVKYQDFLNQLNR
jgi:hypothetical protein